MSLKGNNSLKEKNEFLPGEILENRTHKRMFKEIRTREGKSKLMKIQRKEKGKKAQVNKFQMKTMTMMIRVTVIFEIKYAIINAYRLFGRYKRNEHLGFISHLKLLRLRRLWLVLQSVEP